MGHPKYASALQFNFRRVVRAYIDGKLSSTIESIIEEKLWHRFFFFVKYVALMFLTPKKKV
ncbi:hypothetical protein Scep_014543 [Stephania cephalantha]|uniref:Uncharacterized protein n=1 Tax=Stephania cephalantha TaxID=152367 RepID=A0AAP0J168_9MAGN